MMKVYKQLNSRAHLPKRTGVNAVKGKSCCSHVCVSVSNPPTAHNGEGGHLKPKYSITCKYFCIFYSTKMQVFYMHLPPLVVFRFCYIEYFFCH